LGSLGDTIAALPCFHQIARAFPRAERRVLTNIPRNPKAPALKTILENSGLVHGYIEYPLKLRDLAQLWQLRRRIRDWNPHWLIYLVEPKDLFSIYRDLLFFKSCGIRDLVGVPYTRSLRQHQRLGQGEIYEGESHRLARCLKPLGDINLDDGRNWDLHLTPAELASTREILRPLENRPFIVCGAGTKMPVKDWGVDNWQRLLPQVGARCPGYGLVMVGSADEFPRGEVLARAWPGRTLNLCGPLTPRESAAVIRQASLFVGHDSGPMHLAASLGIPCVAVFSARNRPGVWFPQGAGHKVLYHQTECFDCRLELCPPRHRRKCIASISVAEVLEAVEEVISARIMPAANVCRK
jgi:ADP-heptose:LPS heptosyltransferase